MDGQQHGLGLRAEAGVAQLRDQVAKAFGKETTRLAVGNEKRSRRSRGERKVQQRQAEPGG